MRALRTASAPRCRTVPHVGPRPPRSGSIRPAVIDETPNDESRYDVSGGAAGDEPQMNVRSKWSSVEASGDGHRLADADSGAADDALTFADEHHDVIAGLHLHAELRSL